MNDTSQNDEQLLTNLIQYIDGLVESCRNDLKELNLITRHLRSAKQAGRMSDIHYNVDQQRVQRTLSKCKNLILLLLTQRKRAINMLKEL